ncbi:hypothetical protein CC2G_011825 [Coprinopsis cinerea AmutBmut pab1-1]|nr:hypothetical protein CC2G_011825 [Coprinopsis cinerea AmutBmut pab1-1]
MDLTSPTSSATIRSRILALLLCLACLPYDILAIISTADPYEISIQYQDVWGYFETFLAFLIHAMSKAGASPEDGEGDSEALVSPSPRLCSEHVPLPPTVIKPVLQFPSASGKPSKYRLSNFNELEWIWTCGCETHSTVTAISQIVRCKACGGMKPYHEGQGAPRPPVRFDTFF